jgi:hypothetical protein
MTLHFTASIALILLIGATVPTLAEEGPNQIFNPCSAWNRSGPKEYKLDTKIIFRGNPWKAKLFPAAL